MTSEPVPRLAENPSSDHLESINAIYSLPMTVVSIAGAYDAKTKLSSYTITPSILPDSNARFRLKYVPTNFSDDAVTLGVDQNGLLSSVVANATGRQGDILVALASTAASVATLGGLGVPLPQTANPATVIKNPNCEKTASFSLVLDLEAIARGVTLPDCSILTTDWVPKPAVAAAQDISNRDQKSARCDFSVCYRPLMNVALRIQNDVTVKEARIVAIDPDLTEGLDLASAPLVARTHTITFSSGLLTSAVVNDPSMALAIASLPLTVLKAILSAPAAITNIQVTNVQTQASLAQQEAALLQAQLTLEKAIAAARTPVPVAGSGKAP